MFVFFVCLIDMAPKEKMSKNNEFMMYLENKPFDNSETKFQNSQ